MTWRGESGTSKAVLYRLQLASRPALEERDPPGEAVAHDTGINQPMADHARARAGRDVDELLLARVAAKRRIDARIEHPGRRSEHGEQDHDRDDEAAHHSSSAARVEHGASVEIVLQNDGGSRRVQLCLACPPISLVHREPSFRFMTAQPFVLQHDRHRNVPSKAVRELLDLRGLIVRRSIQPARQPDDDDICAVVFLGDRLRRFRPPAGPPHEATDFVAACAADAPASARDR